GHRPQLQPLEVGQDEHHPGGAGVHRLLEGGLEHPGVVVLRQLAGSPQADDSVRHVLHTLDHRSSSVAFIVQPSTPRMDRLTYIGHATTLLRLDGVSILTDPMLRGWLGPLRRQGPSPDPMVPHDADLVLISHLHRDHLDVPSLRRVPANTPVVVPRDAARWTAEAGAADVHEVGVGEAVWVGGVRDAWGAAGRDRVSD